MIRGGDGYFAYENREDARRDEGVSANAAFGISTQRTPIGGTMSGTRRIRRHGVRASAGLYGRRAVKPFAWAVLALALLLPAGCAAETARKPYGVFLSVTEDLRPLESYETVVVDAQYFSKEDIDAFKSSGHKVYSYINVGSLEEFRPYYETFRDLTLAPYENWDEEYWIDVSDEVWQAFVIGELIPALLEKDVDGFFVDNCDVYYHYAEEPILDGLTAMMRAMISTGKAVLINGGDAYLDAYCAGGGRWEDVITGINQETVFSRILWDGDRFGRASREDRSYYTDYVERYAALGADVYLLEYTRSGLLRAEIDGYCRKNGFLCYVSDSVELD